MISNSRCFSSLAVTCSSRQFLVARVSPECPEPPAEFHSKKESSPILRNRQKMGYSHAILAILLFTPSYSHDLAAPYPFLTDDKSHQGTSLSCSYHPFSKRRPLLSAPGHRSASCKQEHGCSKLNVCCSVKHIRPL